MKISIGWLSEFVTVPWSPPELASRLTMAGLEVESVERVGHTLNEVVVGEVLEMAPHPRTPTLQVCTVGVGQGRRLSIVCGAPNVTVGCRAPVALPGALLPEGRRITRAVIRGVTSEGMLCSEADLGLGEDTSGLLLLPSSTGVGTSLARALALEDTILEIAVTPNRGDCLSHLGIAREVAALSGRAVRVPSPPLRDRKPPVTSAVSVTVRAPALCPRYVARVVRGLTVRPSPLSLRLRLLRIGIRPINNIVDVTHYVMAEVGQPLHAFDVERLRGRRIVVRRAREGETLVTVDGVHRSVTPHMLVIADAERPVAIAGVMGGEESGVRGDTRSVLIESAFFDPGSVRQTAKALGLSTEASYRFERGVDIDGVARAASRAAQLMGEVGGGEIAAGIVDVSPRKKARSPVSLRLGRASALVGYRVETREAGRILTALGFRVTPPKNGVLRVTVPSHRHDIRHEVDLIEEITRISGFDRIPTTLPAGVVYPPSPSLLRSVEGLVKRMLAAAGFTEAVTFSFTTPGLFDKLRLSDDDPRRGAVTLSNPLSEEGSLLRTMLFPSLFPAAAVGARERGRVRLFEIARTYHPVKEAGKLPEEQVKVAALVAGLREIPHWSRAHGEVDFYDLKGVLEEVGRGLGITWDFRPDGKEPYLSPACRAEVWVEGERVGVIGQIHWDVAEAFGVPRETFLCEVDLESLARRARLVPRVILPPRFPAVLRDIAIQVPEETSAARIVALIREAGGDVLESCHLFDIYRGDKIPPGSKSLAFSLVYRALDRTLTDDVVAGCHQRIADCLRDKLGAVIR